MTRLIYLNTNDIVSLLSSFVDKGSTSTYKLHREALRGHEEQNSVVITSNHETKHDSKDVMSKGNRRAIMQNMKT